MSYGRTSEPENHTERSRYTIALADSKTAATPSCCVAFLCSNNIKLYNAEMGPALWKMFRVFFECNGVAGMKMFRGQCVAEVNDQAKAECKIAFSNAVATFIGPVSQKHVLIPRKV